MKMDKNKQYELIQNFVSNMKTKRDGISNIYVFETTDLDGNITDIKYGMNLMTNTGFNAIYKTGSSFALSDSLHLYLGNGVSNFDKTTSRMESPIFGGLAATNSNTSKDYAYPIMYSRGQTSDTGLITLISRFGIVYYDYNIANYDTDTLVSEYGIGTGYNTLWTHSHIYNDRGEKSQITKKKNERMTIYIYMCMSFYEHVIMDNWANDVYVAITTNAIMFQKMFESNIYTYKRNNILVDRTSGRQQTYNDVLTPEDQAAGIDNIIRNTTVAPGFTLWSQKGNDSGYIDGFVFKAPGYIAISPEYLPTPESFIVNGFESENITIPNGFSNKIGKTITDDTYDKNKWPIFTTMSNLSVYTYNYNTSDWDSPCPFMNNNNTHYTNAGLETNYALPIYYWANGAIQTAYLFQNIEHANDILSVNKGHSFLVACSKYWDQSTWINIVDFDNLPEGVENAPFWIAGTNTTNIVPKREVPMFELLESEGGTNGYRNFVASEFGLIREGAWPNADCVDTNCMVIGGRICALNRSRGYQFVSNTADMAHFSYGKWLITFRSVNNSIYTIDTSGLNDAEPDASVLTVTRALEFSTNVNAYTQTYRTENGNGIICIQSLTSTAEAIILDISGDTITSILTQWSRSCCIYGTSYIAYEPAAPDGYIHIYDMSVDADIGTIELPAGFTTSVMFGNGDHLWFYNGTNTYHVDLSSVTHVIESCNNINPATFANSYRLLLSHVEGVTTICDSRTNTQNLTDVFFVTSETPLNIRNFSEFYTSGSDMYEPKFKYTRLTYVNSGTLVCFIMISNPNTYSPASENDTRFYIIDLGRYIRTGVKAYRTAYFDANCCGVYMYGNKVFYNGYYLFPVVNALQLKITGETKTITAFNHTKRISGKTFELGFTNMPTWGYEVNGSGKPPGTPSPILNGEGRIIGWG